MCIFLYQKEDRIVKQGKKRNFPLLCPHLISLLYKKDKYVSGSTEHDMQGALRFLMIFPSVLICEQILC